MISIRRIGISVALLCAGAATVLTAAPAQAQPAAVRAAGVLALSVVPTTAPARSALLRCGADGGTHAAATAACDDLRAVSGQVGALAEDGGICTREYAPVTATAVGIWQGRPLSYRAVFSNECELLLATGHVFQF